MTDCLFCNIVHKQIPSETVYEDGHTVAFLDINPRAPGHAMVVNKRHSENLLDLPDEAIEPLFIGVKRVMGKIKRALAPDGFTIGINHGRVSGQIVEHLHIHVIPRFKNDGGGSIQSVVENSPKEPLKDIAEKIRSSR